MSVFSSGSGFWKHISDKIIGHISWEHEQNVAALDEWQSELASARSMDDLEFCYRCEHLWHAHSNSTPTCICDPLLGPLLEHPASEPEVKRHKGAH